MLKRQQVNSSTIIRAVLAVIYIGIAGYFFMRYWDYRTAGSTPIAYTYAGKKINKGGRGESYDMFYTYKGKEGTISLTSKEYYGIDEQQYPELYYSERSGSVFSCWEIKMSLRIVLLFCGLLIVTVFPWSIVSKKFDAMTAAKNGPVRGKR